MSAPDGRPFNIRNEFRAMSTEQIKEITKSQSLPYAVMALNIISDLNIANMIRAVNICACRKMVILGRKKMDYRGCVGAQNYVDIDKVSALINPDLRDFDSLTQDDVDNIIDSDIFIDYIIQNDYIPVFIEQDSTSIPATDTNIKEIFSKAESINKMPIFIFGNESFGIPKNILDTRSIFPLAITLELKQMGCIRSFNVANCCSILCYKIMENIS